MLGLGCKLVCTVGLVLVVGLENAYRTALGLVFINGADDVIGVAEILEEYFVKLPLLVGLQGTLLAHENQNTHTPHTIFGN